MRVVLLVLLSLFPAAAIASELNLAGTISAHDGTPPRAVRIELEHASATPLKALAPRAGAAFAHAEGDAGGAFRIRVPTPGVYNVWVYAPGHETEVISLHAWRHHTSLNMEVRLRAVRVPDATIDVTAHVRSPDAQEVTMERREHGTWSAELPSRAPVQYRISFEEAATLSRAAFAPADADQFVWTRYGWAAIASPIDGRVALSFTPPRTKPGVIAEAAHRAEVRFVPDERGVRRELHELTAEFRRNARGWLTHRERKAGSDLDDLQLAQAQRFVARFRDTSAPLELRDAAAILAVSTSWKLNDKDRAAIREVLDPSCPLWALNPLFLHGNLTSLFGTGGQMRAYAHATAEGAPDRRTRAWAQLYLSRVAKETEDDAAEERWLASLQREFADLPEIVRELKGPQPRLLRSGDRTPAFEFTSLNGVTIRHDRTPGQHTLLVFSADWCPPCAALIPQLAAVRERVPESRLRMVTAMFDADVAKARAYLATRPQPWHHVALGNDEESAGIRRAFGVSEIPQLYLIGPDGTIVATDKELLRGKLISNLVLLLDA